MNTLYLYLLKRTQNEDRTPFPTQRVDFHSKNTTQSQHEHAFHRRNNWVTSVALISRCHSSFLYHVTVRAKLWESQRHLTCILSGKFYVSAIRHVSPGRRQFLNWKKFEKRWLCSMWCVISCATRRYGNFISSKSLANLFVFRIYLGILKLCLCVYEVVSIKLV